MSINSIFHLCPQIVMEEFEDGALLLRLTDRHLIELNSTDRYIIAQTDGRRNAAQVAAAMAEFFQVDEAEAIQNTLLLYEQLSAHGIIEIIEPNQKGDNLMKEATVITRRYTQNPDVVLREEDEDGGLLFNPDTNQVKVINSTGLFIWKQCNGNHNLDEIIITLSEAFEDVPPDRVAPDVKEFVEEMVDAGFIGLIKA